MEEKLEYDFDFLLDKDDFKSETDSPAQEHDSSQNNNNNRVKFGNMRRDYQNRIREQIRQLQNSRDNKNVLKESLTICAGFVLAYFAFLLVNNLFFGGESLATDDLRMRFSTQDEVLWDVLETNVNDVKLFKRPATMMLLYEEEAESTLNRLLPVLGKYTACNVTDCDQAPLLLSDTRLNYDIKLNYPNNLLEKYRRDLQKKGVMVVTNLENVSGTAGRSFYNFCDKTSPVVRKAMFIFTMKVAEFHNDNRAFLEAYFKLKWGDIKSDRLDAILKRISENIIEIRP